MKIRLDFSQTGVKDIVYFGLGGHLWHILVAIDDLDNVDHFVTEFFSHFLSADLPLLLVRQVDDVDSDAPHLPGNTLVRERPAGLLLLVEFQGNLTDAITSRNAQSVLQTNMSTWVR